MEEQTVRLIAKKYAEKWYPKTEGWPDMFRSELALEVIKPAIEEAVKPLEDTIEALQVFIESEIYKGKEIFKK